MKKINYGILSTATIAPRFMKGVQESEHGVIKAVASRNLVQAQTLADQFNVEKAYGSYEELLQDASIDIVYIPTPNYLHYEHAMKALESGKHVVCEKPFMLTTKQAKEIFAYAKKKNLFAMETQKIVFLPITNWLKEMIGENAIGEISYVQLMSSFPPGTDKSHWMYSHEKGGGVFYGSASYTIEYMQYVFDTKIKDFQGLSVVGDSGVDEVGTINLKINNQTIVSSTISRLAITENIAIFHGSLGRIEVPSFWKSDRAKVIMNDGRVEEIKKPFSSEFVYEVNHINECILQGLIQSPIMDEEKTLNCIEIVESIIKDNHQN